MIHSFPVCLRKKGEKRDRESREGWQQAPNVNCEVLRGRDQPLNGPAVVLWLVYLDSRWAFWIFLAENA
jgi:hypothetical protein